MELKDMILSTLAELEDGVNDKLPANNEIKKVEKTEISSEPKKEISQAKEEETSCVSEINTEMMFLNSIRERLLVLFEGFQAPNNTNIEAKVDMTLNFLEYVLATIDTRVESIKRGDELK